MKKTGIVLAALLLFSHCKDKIVSPYYIQAEVNGALLKQDAIGKYAAGVSTIGIHAEKINEEHIIKESMEFVSLPQKIGKFYLDEFHNNYYPPTASYFSNSGNDDIMTDCYLIKTHDSTNYIHIESFDTITKEMRGSFQMRLQQEYGKNPIHTLDIKAGRFYVKLVTG